MAEKKDSYKKEGEIIRGSVLNRLNRLQQALQEGNPSCPETGQPGTKRGEARGASENKGKDKGGPCFIGTIK